MPGMHAYLLILGITLLALAVNVPLGYFRQRCEKFTFPWYFYVHISIPLIIFIRVKAGFSWHVIPFTLGGAVVGQLIGGRIRRRLDGEG